LTEVFSGFPQSLQANAGIVPDIRPPPLPSKSFPIHHSLITISFDAIIFFAEKASLNKIQRKLINKHEVLAVTVLQKMPSMLCLRSEDAFVITCVANLMEVKVLYVQQDLRYEISSNWRFNV
jgi:hypothetical protein